MPFFFLIFFSSSVRACVACGVIVLSMSVLCVVMNNALSCGADWHWRSNSSQGICTANTFFDSQYDFDPVSAGIMESRLCQD